MAAGGEGGGGGRNGSGGGHGYEIDSMRSGWHPALAKAKSAYDEFLQHMQAFTNGVGDTPTDPATKDAAQQLLAALGPVPDRIDEINGVTRQADRNEWDRLVDNPRPNDHKWTRG